MKDMNVVQAYFKVIPMHLKVLMKHSIGRDFSLMIVLIFFMLLFVRHGTKNMPTKVEMVKSNSETGFGSIKNIPSSLGVKKLKLEEHLRKFDKNTFKIFPSLYAQFLHYHISSEIDLHKNYEKSSLKHIKQNWVTHSIRVMHVLNLSLDIIA